MTTTAMPPVTTPRASRRKVRSGDEALSAELAARLTEILARRPAVGLSLGLLRGGHLAFAAGGLADVAARTEVTADTVFRIGSITKTVTAIGVMQLVERGLIDLDAPADSYLRAFRLVRDGFPSPTVRHLLTHTAGIPDMRGIGDLRYASLTPEEGRPPLLSVPFGETLPSLAEYYRDGLEVVAEPGRTFAYCNHGFATLGQIIEDVSGLPLDRYFRERILGPLGMVDTDLVRSDRIASRLATAYAFGRRGLAPVPDRDWIGAAGGGLYSTVRDLARYATALLDGGTNEHGSVLEAETLAVMFERHFQPDVGLVGMGLGFFRTDVAGHRIVSHDGILPGFHSRLAVAPDDGVALIGLTNGSPGAFAWLQVELDGLLHELLGVAPDASRGPVPHHPEIWGELCGRYVLPARVADIRERLLFGVGAEVVVRGGRLLLRVLAPIPALLQGLPLEPDDATDPYAFRVDLSRFGMPPVRLAFRSIVDGRATVVWSELAGQPWAFERAAATDSRAWRDRAAVVAVAAGAVALARRRKTS